MIELNILTYIIYLIGIIFNLILISLVENDKSVDSDSLYLISVFSWISFVYIAYLNWDCIIKKNIFKK